jgi:hypothetical protein
MNLPIESEATENLALLTSNWRHNLRRTQRTKFTIEEWRHPVAAQVAGLYEEMEDYKGLSPQHNADSLHRMFAAFEGSLLVYRCVADDGRLLAIRACGVLGTRAWDLLAATSVAGRKVYAAYALFWGLLERCRQLGVSLYDFSGVDPDGNPGVFNFKKGTGAELFEYLGEWEIASPRLLSSLANRRLRVTSVPLM